MVKCQGCGAVLTQTLVDLGMSPLANSYVTPDGAGGSDPVYPLHARVCNSCWLVQVESVVPAAEIFSHYAYFSSYSTSFLAHAADYCTEVVRRFELNGSSEVIEIASNDGYLLQYFVARGIPSLGIEPAANVADVARAKGVPTVSAFFGQALARELAASGHKPRLIVSNNVLAHVPDINDFVAGLAILMTEDTVYTVEFPHLLNLIKEVQFDTIYHEHYTYLSLLAVETIFARHGLRAFDVEEISTHGGSLRIYACQRASMHPESARVDAVRRKEREALLHCSGGYDGYEAGVVRIKRDLLAFLERAKAEGARVAGYGAAAKGNTLLNYCGIGVDLLPFVVDRNPAKQNLLLPGSHIPIRGVQELEQHPVDYLLILPWNLRAEIMQQLSHLSAAGCRFVTAIPELHVH
jgi:hypothetical protein